MRKVGIVALPLVVLAFVVTAVGAHAGDRVRLCHYTGDQNTPYTVIEMSASGAYHAHYPHHRDIIPPFEYRGETYSRNWGPAGRATWNNGCVPTTPSGTGGGGGGGRRHDKPPQVDPKAVKGDPTFTG